MKYLNVKIAALILSLFTVLALSGCGSSGTSSNNELVGGEPVAAPVVATPYEITAHHGSEAVVHAHVEPSPEGHEYAHEWTQVSGPTVALTTTTEPTTTFVTPAVAPPPVDSGKPQVATPYEITAHHGSEAVVHSQVTPSSEGHTYTHTWTQVSGPTVALTTTTEPTTTFVTPAVAPPPVDSGKPQVATPYEITAHHGSEAVVHSQVTPSSEGHTYTHTWTQVSGPAVALTTKTGPTTSFVVPKVATQPLVLQHTVINKQTGQTTKSQHTVKTVPATPALSVVVSKNDEAKSGTVTSLYASASGGDGIYTYEWKQLTGTKVTLDLTHPSTPTFVAPPLNSVPSAVSTAEALTFSVTVTDGSGATVFAEETITVIPAAIPQPLVLQHTVINKQTGQTTKSQHTVKTVPATPALSVVVSKNDEAKSGTVTSLYASASGGDGIYSYVWTQKSGPAVALDLAHPSAPHIHVPVVTTRTDMVFTVEVTDGTGTTVSATETITVVPVAVAPPVVTPPANTPPAADAGRIQHVKTGDHVTLNGTGSSDHDYDILNYTWTIISSPGGSTASLSDTSSVIPTFTPDVAGIYIFQLIVNDGTVDSAPDTVTITAEPPHVNSIPVAHAGPDQHVNMGATVVLDGSGSSDGDGDTLTYRWQFRYKPAGSSAVLAGDTSSSPTFKPDVEGIYLVEMRVDDGEAHSGIDQLEVKVSP